MVLQPQQLRHRLDRNTAIDQVSDVSLSKPSQVHSGGQSDYAGTRFKDARECLQHRRVADQIAFVRVTRDATIIGHSLHYGRRERHGSRSRTADVDFATPANPHDISPAYLCEFGCRDAGPINQRQNCVLSDRHVVGGGESRQSQTLLRRRMESVIHALQPIGSRDGGAATFRNRAKAQSMTIPKLKGVSRPHSTKTSKAKIVDKAMPSKGKAGTLSAKKALLKQSVAPSRFLGHTFSRKDENSMV